jgi:hypothetical protein
MSEPDDNPFGRNSAWPKMPQAPFRLGALPKAGVTPAQPAPTPEPLTQTPAITPLYVRPVEGAVPPPPSATRPTFITRPPPEAAPAPQRPAPEPPPQPVEAQAAEIRPLATVPPIARPPVELEPLIVQPLARATSGVSSNGGGRSKTPAVVAAVIGVAVLGGLVFALSQGHEDRPVPRAPSAASAIVSTTQQSVTARREAQASQPATPEPKASTPSARATQAPRAAAASAAATEAATPAPVLALPPAQPTPVEIAPPPAPEPLPAYKPPTTPDPNAPMTTQRPY